MVELKIYKVIDGQDNWPLVDIITAENQEEATDKAIYEYGQDEYHWVC